MLCRLFRKLRGKSELTEDQKNQGKIEKYFNTITDGQTEQAWIYANAEGTRLNCLVSETKITSVRTLIEQHGFDVALQNRGSHYIVVVDLSADRKARILAQIAEQEEASKSKCYFC